MYHFTHFIYLLGFVGSTYGLISPRQAPGAPTVSIPSGTFKGNTTSGVEAFYGLPYAAAPVGNLRFRPPAPVTKKYPNFDATRQPPVCTQHGNPITKLKESLPFKVPELLGQEDCLTLDILRPAGVKKGAKLPVYFSIFAGGFTFGYSAQFKGNSLVKKSVDMKTPIIFVAINHRLNIFGFLGGKEVGAAGVGNLGLLDQRMALRWVRANIAEFGGDPTKVTIGGASSGGMSSIHQMMANNGDNEGLFRAVIAESGVPWSTASLAEGAGQAAFNALAKDTGCGGAPNKLDCMRSVDYKKLTAALGKMPESVVGQPFVLAFFPHVDGKFVTSSLEDALSKGKLAKVPFISGNTDDEGTRIGRQFGTKLFTPNDLTNQLKHFFPGVTAPQMTQFLQVYHSNDVTQGSPFNTGFFDALSPFYKQFSAMTGDILFHAPRRFLMKTVGGSQPIYGYVDRGNKGLPFVGATHAQEVAAVYGILPGPRTNDFEARWISFVNKLDPNAPGLPRWDRYSTGSLLEFTDLGSSGMTPDNYRADGINFLIKNIKSFRVIAV